MSATVRVPICIYKHALFCFLSGDNISVVVFAVDRRHNIGELCKKVYFHLMI